MPNVDGHQPGAFCWVELATLDVAAAKKFYGALFGWTFADFPMGEFGEYTIFRINDRDVAAAYPMMPDQRAQGIPPNWMSYVSVESADDIAAKVTTLGGAVMAPPMDVFDMGRMVVLTDPTHAVLSVWQPKSHKGFGLTAEPGTFCWSELWTGDPAKAKTFHTSLFGWTTDIMPSLAGGDYTIFKTGEIGVGGMLEIPKGHGDIPPHWLPYFAVADCDATVEKAKAAGGIVHMTPVEIPNVGRFAALADPQGAAFAVLKPSM
jgi:predicted enzyme related to lactoylglutathione lyase